MVVAAPAVPALAVVAAAAPMTQFSCQPQIFRVAPLQLLSRRVLLVRLVQELTPEWPVVHPALVAMLMPLVAAAAVKEFLVALAAAAVAVRLQLEEATQMAAQAATLMAPHQGLALAPAEAPAVVVDAQVII